MKSHYIIFFIVFLFSCRPDNTEINKFNFNKDDVKIIELRANSNMMFRDKKLEFKTVLYGVRNIKVLYKTENNQIISYKDSIRPDTFIIPQDRYSEDIIKIYDGNGLEVKNYYSPSESENGSVTFYAKLDDLRSDIVNVNIRELPTDNWENLDIPVVFHILLPPSYAVPAMNVTTVFLQSKIDLLNKIYNAEATNNPNSKSACITFKLAKFDNNGARLIDNGLNRLSISNNLSQGDILNYIKENAVWDPNKYLNIWVYDLSNGRLASDGSTSYKTSMPNVLKTGEELIPGLKTRYVDNYIFNKQSDISDFGIVYNKSDFLTPSNIGGSEFSLARVIAEYYGLYKMKYTTKFDWRKRMKVSNIIDGDTDYCPDTPIYEYNLSLYKKDFLNGNYYTSYNIMEDYSQHNSITYHQAKRIREVLKKCPSRWSYKSKWAFNGEN